MLFKREKMKQNNNYKGIGKYGKYGNDVPSCNFTRNMINIWGGEGCHTYHTYQIGKYGKDDSGVN